MNSNKEWQKKQLLNFIKINPMEKVKKGSFLKKVSMADIQPYNRKIENYTISKYSGGSKFRNGDTLMARITPCLENGKTAFVDILDKKEIAYGSTEFIVLRNIQDESINKYVYYFTISPKFRNIAIKSMTGTSGRQRVQENILKNLVFFIPEIEEQEKIVSILSSLDDKIELNNQINKNLEELAQAIFKHWFIDFEFPDENAEPYKSSGGEMVDSEMGPIPKGWGIANFNAFVNEISNGDWGKASASDNYEKKVYCMRGADIPEICKGKKGKMPLRYILEKNLNKKVLCAGDLVIEISGGSPTQSTGRTTYINQDILSRYDTKLICSNFCKVIKLIDKEYCEYLFLYLTYLYELNIFFNFENGTTGIKNLDIKNLFEKYKIKVPDELTIIKFRKIIKGLFRKIQENGYENNKLSSLRDALIPKFISGEIRVPINDKEGDEQLCKK